MIGISMIIIGLGSMVGSTHPEPWGGSIDCEFLQFGFGMAVLGSFIAWCGA